MIQIIQLQYDLLISHNAEAGQEENWSWFENNRQDSWSQFDIHWPVNFLQSSKLELLIFLQTLVKTAYTINTLIKIDTDSRQLQEQNVLILPFILFTGGVATKKPIPFFSAITLTNAVKKTSKKFRSVQ